METVVGQRETKKSSLNKLEPGGIRRREMVVGESGIREKVVDDGWDGVGMDLTREQVRRLAGSWDI